MKHQRITTCIFFFVLAVGICTGSFFEVYLNGAGKDAMGEALGSLLSQGAFQMNADEQARTGLQFLELYWDAIKNDLLVMLISYLAPVLWPVIPLLPLFVFAKGLSIGFSSALTLEIFGISGIRYLLTTLLPHNLVQVPLLCVLAALSTAAGLYLFREFLHGRGARIRRNEKALQSAARQYHLYYAVGLLLLIISCIPEVFLLQ